MENKLIQAMSNPDRVSRSEPLKEHEIDAVIYFFAKLKLADPRFYTQAMPDEKTEKLTKREFSEFIRVFTKQQIDTGFYTLNKLMMDGDEEYRFLTIQKAIGLVQHGANTTDPAHKYFKPVTSLEDITAKEKRIEMGLRHTKSLLSMFGEDNG